MAEPNATQRYKMEAQLGAYDPYTRSVPVIASTPSPVEGEALTDWDLERFKKNPVCMWSHINPANGVEGSLPIGKFKDVEYDPVAGLKGRVYFANASTNPLAEKVEGLVRDDFLRAVSVGYISLGGGKAQLLELSFVPIGADEDAGTPNLNPNAVDDDGVEEEGEALRVQIAKAASELGKQGARMRAKKRSMEATSRTDKADTEVERLDLSKLRLDHLEDSPSGGKKIPARLARTGVLMYRDPSMPDGWRRELRLEEEQFDAESMATLDHAVIIDYEDHKSMVTPDTWQAVARGSVGTPRADGKFIAATLHVQDKKTLEAIERGERSEISLGYRCRLDDALIEDGIYVGPGSHNGTRADFVQRGLRFNHAALCPPNGGRAGNDVGLRLDSSERQSWAVAHIDQKDDEAMADNNSKTIVKTRVDGREVEEFSKDHFDALERVHQNALTKLIDDGKKATEIAVAEVQKRLDQAEGDRDALKTNLDKAKAEKEEVEKKALEERKASEEETGKDLVKKVKRFAKMWRTIERLFGKPKDEEEEKKLDTIIGDEREMMLYAIQKSDPHFDGKDSEGKPRSLDYIESRWDGLEKDASKKESIASVVGIVHAESERVDARDESAFEANALAFIQQQKAQTDRLKNGGGNSSAGA